MRTEVKDRTPPVATGCVDRAVLAPHHKVVHIAQREGHGGDSHRFALFEDQLQTVLQGKQTHAQGQTLPSDIHDGVSAINPSIRAQRTCGWESMSRLQEHILPSVEMLIRLLAFWVPTTFTQ